MLWVVFKTFNHYYIYDRQENRIGEIPGIIFAQLEKAQNEKKDITEEAALKLLQKNGFCRNNWLKRIEHSATRYLESYLNQEMRQIILQITQNCNLRCKYCVYSDSGKYNNRRHSNKMMNFDTAKKSIDFLIEHSVNTPKVYIGFYGGEPLLNYALIQNVVAYVEKEYEDKEIQYAMTTNATLLTENIIDFIVDKGFSLTISLDGPENVQNKQRCFASGEGSFQRVIDNLTLLKEKYPAFYSKCFVSTTLPQGQEFGCIRDFLTKGDIIDCLQVKVGLLSDIGVGWYEPYDDSVIMEREKEKLHQMLEAIGVCDKTKTFRLFGDYIASLSQKYNGLLMGKQFFTKGHPGGPCIAGVKRAFVDVKGDIYPCEKLPEHEELKIGNINVGFNTENIKYMINIAATTEEYCRECWAFPFCTSCIAASVGSDGLSSEKRLSKCSAIRRSVLESLREIKILEEYGFDIKGYSLMEVAHE